MSRNEDLDLEEDITLLISKVLASIREQIQWVVAIESGPVAPEVDKMLAQFDERNDYHSIVLHQRVITNKTDGLNPRELQLFISSYDLIIRLLNKLGHRLGLVMLEDWINEHLNNLLESLDHAFQLVENIVDPTESCSASDALKDVMKVQHDSEHAHLKFLRKLYSVDRGARILTQAEAIDLTIMEAIDQTSRLAQRSLVLFKNSSNTV
ncbi:MAG: hypothetical protein BAJATHORv1_80022 [Candidatus Thorarchaeota archaeon]|nr:MAG: hypothetical protein BAJATHORv1_80022 [Candidatus Thorarchaeota archaeon]